MPEETHNKIEKRIRILPDLDNHELLGRVSGASNKVFVKEFCNQIIEQYNCTTSLEKALAEVIVGAHIRILEISEKLNDVTNADYGHYYAGYQYLSQQTKFYAMLGKELDRAHRQFINALNTLKQLKAPNIEISVKAKNAFVSQNQQINAGEPKEYENIKS